MSHVSALHMPDVVARRRTHSRAKASDKIVNQIREATAAHTILSAETRTETVVEVLVLAEASSVHRTSDRISTPTAELAQIQTFTPLQRGLSQKQQDRALPAKSIESISRLMTPRVTSRLQNPQNASLHSQNREKHKMLRHLRGRTHLQVILHALLNLEDLLTINRNTSIQCSTEN